MARRVAGTSSGSSSTTFPGWIKKGLITTMVATSIALSALGVGAFAHGHSHKGLEDLNNRIGAVEEVVIVSSIEDKQELGQSNILSAILDIIAEDGVDKGYVQSGAQITGGITVEADKDKNTTTLLCEVTEPSGEKKIASFTISGVALSSTRDLYICAYGTNSADLKAAIEMEKPYQKIGNLYSDTLLSGLKTEESDPIADIESKLRQIWELQEDAEVMARSLDSTVDGVNIYELEVRVDAGEGAIDKYVKFQQNSKEDVSTFYNRILMTLSKQAFNGSFGVEFKNSADRIEFNKALIEVNQPATTPSEGETQTGSESGASTEDPNAAI